MFTAAPNCPGKWNATQIDSFMSVLRGDYVTVIDSNRLSEALVFLQDRCEERFFQCFDVVEL